MGRAPCCDKANVKRGPWSPEEDAVLRNYVERQGTGGNWIALPHKAGLKRCGKSCRLRWLNYLRPDIKHGGFTEEEDSIICTLYKSIGSRWSVIASHLPGRTDNDVKNYWNTKLKKKLMAAQTPITSTNYIHHSPSPASTPPPPLVPTVKSEADASGKFSMPPVDDTCFGYTQDSQRMFWELTQFQSLGLLDSADINLDMTGYVVSPHDDGSATSSSITVENSNNNNNNSTNWCANGVGGDDLFLSELRFAPPSEFLSGYGSQEKMGEIAPCYSSVLSNMWATAPETKSGLCQGVTYS